MLVLQACSIIPGSFLHTGKTIFLYKYLFYFKKKSDIFFLSSIVDCFVALYVTCNNNFETSRPDLYYC